MLIKYKTEPTIIVLSPNSANLIKILTQFVYSINIRYFSPTSLPCPVALRGVLYSKIQGRCPKDGGVEKTSAATKSNLTLSPCRAPQHYGVFCTAKYRGGDRRTEGLKNSDNSKIKPHPLPLSCLVALQGATKQHREKGCVAILLPCTPKNKKVNSQNKDLYSTIGRIFKTPPLCFVQQNIGEVSEGRRG